MAFDDDRAVVGAIWDDQGGLNAGAAYAFLHDGDRWNQEQKLVPTDAQENDEFGRVVAIDGDTIIVGTSNDLGLGGGTGAAYIFKWTGFAWIEEQQLVPLVGDFADAFGKSVAISGNMAVIGASRDDDVATDAGAVYVFNFDGKAWTQQQKLLASDGTSSAFFGNSVGLAGDVILVGAPNGNGLSSGSGCAYIFRWDGRSWIEEQKLIADDTGGRGFGDEIGLSVGLSTVAGGTAVLGHRLDNDVGINNGSAYIFTYNGADWIQTQELFSIEPPPLGGEQFGYAVAVDDDLLVIGAPFGDTTGTNDGAAYVFRYEQDTAQWLFQEQLLPEAIASTSFFGYSVAISEGTAVIGAYGEFSQSGRAYVFNVDPGSADLDCDGSVGPDDLAELLAQWGACPPPEVGECSADVAPPDAPDGTVGPADLAELLANWG